MLQALKKYESMTSVIERCNDTVLEVLHSGTVREAEIAAESFKNGGKRLRPALMILSSLVPTGGDLDDVQPSVIELAAAVELIHLATLFHDDVIDEVDSRREQVSARVKYGNHASVLAGDFTLAEALLLVHRSGVVHTMPEFLRTIRVLVRGESRETLHKFDFNLNEALYYEIISEKSASLFALSCKVGGMITDSEYTDLLGHFGWNLGMAFQMIDDLDDMLDLPRGNLDCDLRNGYIALPVIRALTALEDGHRDELVGLIRKSDFSPNDERRIVDICNDHDGIEHTSAKIDKHLDRASEMIERFDDSDAKQLLAAVAVDLKAYAHEQREGFLAISKSL